MAIWLTNILVYAHRRESRFHVQAQSTVQQLAEAADFEVILADLIERPRVRGPIVHDARIVALCLAHGVEELLSKDRDVQLFPELQCRDPLA